MGEFIETNDSQILPEIRQSTAINKLTDEQPYDPCWMRLVHHTTKDGMTIVLDCDAYGDAKKRESYRAHFIDNYGQELGRTIVSGTIYMRADRTRYREIVTAESAGQEVIRINLCDFTTTYQAEGEPQPLLPIDNGANLGRVD